MNERLLAREIKLEKFRSFENVNIQLGRKLTVVSGVNGVGKSNILSLLASGSGLNKKSQLASNFQPEFTEFFNIDAGEKYSDYKIFVEYVKENGDYAIARRLSFKDDTSRQRGIRIIPRSTNEYEKDSTIKEVEKRDKENYDVGGSGRVKIPTIYMSLSRLYPLGERVNTVKISKVRRNNVIAQRNVMDKYREWYNYVIPNAISESADLSIIEKGACSRASLHMEMENTPTLSQSIGQDNIGNIISAFADLYLLSLEDDYHGAIICIDEIEVSLHPDTQRNMLDLIDKLSDELKLQVVVSTHSLTVLKECLKFESKNPEDYKVVYLKNPLAPLVTEKKNYDLLKADMFGMLSFNKPKVKIYFEDVVGKTIFEELIKAYKSIYLIVNNTPDGKVLRNADKCLDYKELNSKILGFGEIRNIEDDIKKIETHLGCENLMDISQADPYFDRIIIMLDGDARVKETAKKPHVKDYLGKRFNPKEHQLNDRKHKPNIIFAPNYFAPESYLYRIIYDLVEQPTEHAVFWRKNNIWFVFSVIQLMFLRIKSFS